jgi:hypothetical protein
VNVAVWVMKPGPMALVAIRNIAPSTALRLVAEPIADTAFASLIAGSLQGRGDPRHIAAGLQGA